MTDKELIISTFECDTEIGGTWTSLGDIFGIHDALEKAGKALMMEEIQKCLEQMLDDEIIYMHPEKSKVWYKGEIIKNVNLYGMTEKGIELWDKVR